MRAKPLVLLVDDEEVFLEIASVTLGAQGFAVARATDFYDALAKAEALLPDLVLSDIYMPPGPSGLDLALELHRNPKTRGVKIAFFTSMRDPWIDFRGNRTQMLAELGPMVFLSKNDDVAKLGDRVTRLLHEDSPKVSATMY